jgi:hypothetical protein
LNITGSLLHIRKKYAEAMQTRYNPPVLARNEGRTRLYANVVNGRRYGYPQALVTHLQHQFQELRVKTTKRDCNRIWKALGFARRSSIFEVGDLRMRAYYIWPAPPALPVPPMFEPAIE